MLFIHKDNTGRKRYSTDENLLKSIINENKNLDKIKNVKELKIGDFVTCCEPKESLDPDGVNVNEAKRYSWEKDKVVLIREVRQKDRIYYILGDNAQNGIHVSGLRYSTKEEIVRWKQGYKYLEILQQEN